jgi:hypothetical protein
MTKLFDQVADRVRIEVEKDGKVRSIELVAARLTLDVDTEVAEKPALNLWREFEPTGRRTITLLAYGTDQHDEPTIGADDHRPVEITPGQVVCGNPRCGTPVPGTFQTVIAPWPCTGAIEQGPTGDKR